MHTYKIIEVNYNVIQSCFLTYQFTRNPMIDLQSFYTVYEQSSNYKFNAATLL